MGALTSTGVGSIGTSIPSRFSISTYWRKKAATGCSISGSFSIVPELRRQKLEASRVLLAVIGAKWGEVRFPAACSDRRKRNRLRLDDPDDWVRQEICTGVRRAAAGPMRVVVVTIDDAKLPDSAW